MKKQASAEPIELPVSAGELCTVAQAAAALGVHPSTVWRWVRAGRLPSYRLGSRSIRIRRRDLARTVRPAGGEPELAPRMETIHTSLASVPPLSPQERLHGLKLMERARHGRAEQRRQNGGKPGPDSTEIVRADREERSRRWW